MTTALFDTHCHLTCNDLYDQIDEVVASANAAGVGRLLTVACEEEKDFERALALADRWKNIHVAAGYHPHVAGRIEQENLQKLADLWDTSPVVAAGEMGLDYHYDFSPRRKQADVFKRQLELAARADLPVIIHCREAHQDLLRILIEQGYRDRRVVIHCFSGHADEAAEIRSHGWWLSFTGVLTFKNAEAIRQACLETPIDKLFFETDAPYLSPEPIRKQRPNTPANMVHTVRFAAELRGDEFAHLAQATTNNALRFFNI
jgi:TatD DNase family protein